MGRDEQTKNGGIILSKLEQYEQLKKQIVAKDWQEYEAQVKAIIAKLKI